MTEEREGNRTRREPRGDAAHLRGPVCRAVALALALGCQGDPTDQDGEVGDSGAVDSGPSDAGGLSDCESYCRAEREVCTDPRSGDPPGILGSLEECINGCENFGYSHMYRACVDEGLVTEDPVAVNRMCGGGCHWVWDPDPRPYCVDCEESLNGTTLLAGVPCYEFALEYNERPCDAFCVAERAYCWVYDGTLGGMPTGAGLQQACLEASVIECLADCAAATWSDDQMYEAGRCIVDVAGEAFDGTPAPPDSAARCNEGTCRPWLCSPGELPPCPAG